VGHRAPRSVGFVLYENPLPEAPGGHVGAVLSHGTDLCSALRNTPAGRTVAVASGGKREVGWPHGNGCPAQRDGCASTGLFARSGRWTNAIESMGTSQSDRCPRRGRHGWRERTAATVSVSAGRRPGAVPLSARACRAATAGTWLHRQGLALARSLRCPGSLFPDRRVQRAVRGGRAAGNDLRGVR